MDFAAICRTCLTTKALSPIFKKENDASRDSEMISLVTGIEIKLNDGLPQNLCKNCLNTINISYNFRKCCKKAEYKLMTFKSNIGNVGIKPFEEIGKIESQELEGTFIADNLQITSITEDKEIKNENNELSEDDDDRPLKYLVSSLNEQNNFSRDVDNVEIKSELCFKNDNLNDIKMELDMAIVMNNTEVEIIKKHTINDHSYAKQTVMYNNNLLTDKSGAFIDCENNNSSKDIVTHCNDKNNVNSETKDSEFYLTKNETDAADNKLYEFDESDPRGRKVTCKLCQKKLSIRSVPMHMAKSHPGADESRVKCDLCDNYILKKNLNRHNILIHELDRFKCRYCKWEFDNKDSLIGHVVICTAKKKRRVCESSRQLRECDICHKMMQKSSLRVHKAAKHAGLRPVCEHCGKNFGNKIRLHEHLRAKHGYEKFKCSYCDFQSAAALAMKNHERRHRGEKPFVCETCGAKFHAAYLLYQHKHSHRTVKDFKCDVCSATFKTNNTLHMHKRACHSSARYSCTLCSRSYTCRLYAQKHMRAVHRYSGPQPPPLAAD